MGARAPDAVLIGGGVMGCASALALAEAGAKVVVLEKSVPGAEASSAAAGILGAQSEAHEPGPLFELARMSRSLYGALAERLQRATGIDVGYRPSGVLEVASDRERRAELTHKVAWQIEADTGVALLERPLVAQLEPALAAENTFGVDFAGDGRIDPPLLLKALHIAASRAGAEFRAGAYVRAIDVDGDLARGVVLEDGARIESPVVVVAAGSWSTLVVGVPLAPGAVKPARGQIALLELGEPPIRRVIVGPKCYLVPRDDGRVLVGSTLEFVGYRREVTARAVRDLLNAAIELVPCLAEATLGRTWSNFRPYTDAGTPFIGPTHVRGLYLATGHYRNGILLAPITAEIVRALAQGTPPPIDLAPFAATAESRP